MPPLRGISGKEAIKKFQRLGYDITRQQGSHVRLRHAKAPHLRKPITVPLHREIKIGLLHQLISDAGSTPQEFLDL